MKRTVSIVCFAATTTALLISTSIMLYAAPFHFHPKVSPKIIKPRVTKVIPTSTPTVSPTDTSTVTPTDSFTEAPTDTPTITPTDSPTVAPTDNPSVAPTGSPTLVPTTCPTITPTIVDPSPEVSAKTTNIDETSNGKTITINKGDSLRIALDSNGTTGYKWDVDSLSNEGILKLISQKYISPITDVVGASGHDEFIFQGDSKGSTDLSLKYWRSFSKSISSTFSVTVNVQ